MVNSITIPLLAIQGGVLGARVYGENIGYHSKFPICNLFPHQRNHLRRMNHPCSVNRLVSLLDGKSGELVTCASWVEGILVCSPIQLVNMSIFFVELPSMIPATAYTTTYHPYHQEGPSGFPTRRAVHVKLPHSLSELTRASPF